MGKLILIAVVIVVILAITGFDFGGIFKGNSSSNSAPQARPAPTAPAAPAAPARTNTTVLQAVSGAVDSVRDAASNAATNAAASALQEGDKTANTERAPAPSNPFTQVINRIVDRENNSSGEKSNADAQSGGVDLDWFRQLQNTVTGGER